MRVGCRLCRVADLEDGGGMTRKPGPCNANECDNPFTRLYPCGWRCADHAPQPRAADSASKKRVPLFSSELKNEGKIKARIAWWLTTRGE